MTAMRHPTFARRLTILFVVVSSLLGLLLLDGQVCFGQRSLTETQLVLLVGGLILSFAAYCFWAANHVRCPQCRVLCSWHSDETNRGRRVACPRCSTVWDLGITFQSDSGG
jgi:hypothetical protein